MGPSQPRHPPEQPQAKSWNEMTDREKAGAEALARVMNPELDRKVKELEQKEEARRHFEKAGGFSFVPPDTWEARADPGEKFKVLVPPGLMRLSGARIVVKEVPLEIGGITPEGSLKVLAYQIKLELKGQINHRIIKEEDFTTRAGLKGVRLIVEYEEEAVEDKV